MSIGGEKESLFLKGPEHVKAKGEVPADYKCCLDAWG